MIDPAIQHAILAHDVEAAARLVEQHAQAYLIRNEINRPTLGLRTASRRCARAARLGLIPALARISGRVQDVEHLLAHVEESYRRARADRDAET